MEVSERSFEEAILISAAVTGTIDVRAGGGTRGGGTGRVGATLKNEHVPFDFHGTGRRAARP